MLVRQADREQPRMKPGIPPLVVLPHLLSHSQEQRRRLPQITSRPRQTRSFQDRRALSRRLVHALDGVQFHPEHALALVGSQGPR